MIFRYEKAVIAYLCIGIGFALKMPQYMQGDWFMWAFSILCWPLPIILHLLFSQ